MTQVSKRSIDEAISLGVRWFRRNQTVQGWKMAVAGEDAYSTALSLGLIHDKRKQKSVEYLIRTGVWRNSKRAAILALEALVRSGDSVSVSEFLSACSRDQVFLDSRGSKTFLENLRRVSRSGTRK